MTASPVQALQDNALAEEVKHKALELGFDLVGVAPAGPSAYRDYFQRWLATGLAQQLISQSMNTRKENSHQRVRR